jgi:hypothetical protein
MERRRDVPFRAGPHPAAVVPSHSSASRPMGMSSRATARHGAMVGECTCHRSIETNITPSSASSPSAALRWAPVWGRLSRHAAHLFDGPVRLIESHRLLGLAYNALEGSDVARRCDDEKALLELDELEPVASLDAQSFPYALWERDLALTI